jgi:hypothetical protein
MFDVIIIGGDGFDQVGCFDGRWHGVPTVRRGLTGISQRCRGAFSHALVALSRLGPHFGTRRTYTKSAKNARRLSRCYPVLLSSCADKGQQRDIAEMKEFIGELDQ